MLSLSTRGRYATRIMAYLASRPDPTPARKQEISEAEQISADYLEQILVELKAAGLVCSFRGAKGGFCLGREAETISVADVLDATEGPIRLAPCLMDHCGQAEHCGARSLWQEAAKALSETFAKTSIAEMAARRRHLQDSTPVSFDI